MGDASFQGTFCRDEQLSLLSGEKFSHPCCSGDSRRLLRLLNTRSQATGGDVLPDQHDDGNHKKDQCAEFISATEGVDPHLNKKG